MTGEFAAAYHSGSQRARVVTEAWGESNLYCPNCSSPKLSRLRNNTKASDYSCPACGFWYQLKGQQSRIGERINDGAYAAMMEAIRRDETPNFYFMQYELATWRVKNLLLVPSFAFPPSAIIKRKPLAPTARRAGWIGCNIALNRVPVEARISVVTESRALPDSEVRAQFRRVKPLSEISVAQRGWTLDVLNAIRRLVSEGRAPRDPNFSGQSGTRITRPSGEFTTADAYAFERELEQLHPDNRHVRDKIRQQLQVLRDLGLLLHVERGVWRLP
jgi:type II restriction enzyme